MHTPTPYCIPQVPCFDLAETFECGQCFRWLPEAGGGYTGVFRDKVITLRRRDTDLLVYGLTPQEVQALLIPYLALDVDYPALQEQFRQYPLLARAVDFAPGIRVLRQDSWEALCTFIISQNNNIKRIRGIVETLCRTFGTPIADGFYSFPTAERLAQLTVEELTPLRCGFRAKYILDAAQRVADGRVPLEEIAAMPLPEAQAALMQIYGVGVKVAQCALLYGFYRTECLPVDVWMRRVMETMFPSGLPKELLPHAGLAQQYLFHYARSHPEQLIQREQH